MVFGTRVPLQLCPQLNSQVGATRQEGSTAEGRGGGLSTNNVPHELRAAKLTHPTSEV